MIYESCTEMRTRRSWRNQYRLHKYQSQEIAKAATDSHPKQEAPIPTDAEIDAMWWIPKQSRRLMKLAAAKKRKTPATGGRHEGESPTQPPEATPGGQQ